MKKSSQRTPLAALMAAKEETNPALTMAWRLKEREMSGNVPITELIEMAPAIDDAIREGDRMVQEMDRALSMLKDAPPSRATRLPVGF